MIGGDGVRLRAPAADCVLLIAPSTCYACAAVALDPGKAADRAERDVESRSLVRRFKNNRRPEIVNSGNAARGCLTKNTGCARPGPADRMRPDSAALPKRWNRDEA